jgi:hypothetical protein
MLIEPEMIEPYFCLEFAHGSVDRLADALIGRLT